ncbi:hypothetical protein [Pseudomonas fluorescens]|uniref:hypothetical protein n=1 Tax=Pseudomonas fluorescens TaxID=294 RepID=UPI00214BFCD2|nr:hypothetical protein [Pseudomonas fluorescens]
MQIASPQKAIIEKCNIALYQKELNSLFLKNLIADRLWHASCWQRQATSTALSARKTS